MFPGPWKDSSYYCKHHKHQMRFAAVPGLTTMVVSIVRYVRNAHCPKSVESVNRQEMREGNPCSTVQSAMSSSFVG
jgi:hypothetical protein